MFKMFKAIAGLDEDVTALHGTLYWINVICMRRDRGVRWQSGVTNTDDERISDEMGRSPGGSSDRVGLAKDLWRLALRHRDDLQGFSSIYLGSPKACGVNEEPNRGPV
jgi:hypothetical protein